MENGTLTKMTDDISFSTQTFGDLCASSDFVEKSRRVVVEEIGEKIESTAMRHRQDNVRHISCKYKLEKSTTRRVYDERDLEQQKKTTSLKLVASILRLPARTEHFGKT